MDLRSPLRGDCDMKEFLDCSGGSEGGSNPRGYVRRGRPEESSKPGEAKRLAVEDMRDATNDFAQDNHGDSNPVNGGYVRRGRAEEGSKPLVAKRLALEDIRVEKGHLPAFKCAILYKGFLGSLGDDRPVLVKGYDPDFREASIMYSTEINILSGLHHPNVVKLIGYCEEDDKMLLVYEDLCLDFLEDRIPKSPSSNEGLSWSKRMGIAHGISEGLKCLHDNGVIFRDLTPYNILIDKDNNPKIFDFVAAQDSNGRGASMTEMIGRIGYLDPASMYGRFSTKSDIYSFGFILLRLITGLDVWAYDAPLLDWVKKRVLHDNGKLKECMDEQFTGIVDKSLHGQYTTGELYQAVDLAISCMDLKEDRRPSIEVVVEKMSLVYRKENDD